ncbi:MAG: class I SAM-dependent methyltransferase [Lysobacteraceae bacterium]|nr:MAG: class I SAM-dependent methyltransferase [Xanthomonadaceae bacterium]
MNKDNAIRNVSDTALWVAIYRAMESERPDAIFHDPHARRLGGERGERVVREMPGAQASSWSLIVRTAVLDRIIEQCIRDGARTVLNLAAGLDARPYRMSLPADLRWIHVDMPEMVDYFRERMADETPNCRLEFVSADLREADARRAVLALAAQEGPTLVITEGLLIYLDEDDVRALTRDLIEIARARWWTADLASPALLKIMAKRWAKTLQAGNAPFRFGPRENIDFFAPFGWRRAALYSLWDESIRYRRTRRDMWFWRLVDPILPSRIRTRNRMIYTFFLLESDMRPKA